MEKIKKIMKNKYMIVGLIGIMIILVGGVSYALTEIDFKGERVVEIARGGLKFLYNEGEETIELNNAKPVSDVTGKGQEDYFDFEVKYESSEASEVEYYIYIDRIEEYTSNDENIKIYLTDQEDNMIVGPLKISELMGYEVEENKTVQLIHNTSITSSNDEIETDEYRIRAWIDEGYDPEVIIGDTTNGQNITTEPLTYKFKVDISTRGPQSTQETCFTYTETTTEVTITGYKCFAGNTYGLPEITDVIIPSKINGKDVVAIADYGFAAAPVFYDMGLTSIILPNTLKTIGHQAFSRNQLPSITVPNGVTSIGDSAFSSNRLTSITISNSVTSIGGSAFWGNQLTNVIIPSSVTTIGDMAFMLNLLTSITIPNSVTSIGAGAFTNNQLSDNEAFIYKRNNDGSIDDTTLVSYGGAKRSGIVIPNNVNVIGKSAFEFSGITSVTIPNSVTTIGDGAFKDDDLTSISIPNSVTTIGMAAFYGNQLSIVTIPANVTTIGSLAFPKIAFANSNASLTKIINQTGRAFYWGGITGGEYASFIIGTVIHEDGNIEVTDS